MRIFAAYISVILLWATTPLDVLHRHVSMDSHEHNPHDVDSPNHHE